MTREYFVGIATGAGILAVAQEASPVAFWPVFGAVTLLVTITLLILPFPASRRSLQ